MWVQLQIWKKKFITIYSAVFFFFFAFGMFHRSVRLFHRLRQADGPVLPLGEPCATHAPGRVTRTAWQSAAGCFERGARQGHSWTSPLRWGEFFLEKIGDEWWVVMQNELLILRDLFFWMHMLLPSLSHSHWKKWRVWCFDANFPWEYLMKQLAIIDVLMTLFGRVNHMNASGSIIQWKWRPCGSMWVNWFLFVWDVKTGSS